MTVQVDDPEHRASTANADTLADRARALRRARGWTLMQLSARTGLAPSTLSKVENRLMSLTYANLRKLSDGLGVDIADLFTAESRPLTSQRVCVTRSGEEVLHESAQYLHAYHGTPLTGRAFAPSVTRLRIRSLQEFGPLLRHPGQEFVYVLSGRVRLVTEDDTDITLRRGDSAYFDCSRAHAFLDCGAPHEETLMLSVMSAPPSEHMDALSRSQADPD